MLAPGEAEPASASAPFVATLVDVSGIVIYFSVAFLVLRGTLLPLGALAVAIALPFVLRAVGLDFYLSLASRIVVYAIAATSLNLVLGYAGLVSFGHAAFFGLGAYVTGIMMSEGGSTGTSGKRALSPGPPAPSQPRSCEVWVSRP